jgi:hypothetical protein
MLRSGDPIIIATFDLMKNEKNCLIKKSFDFLFRSHEIRPPDPQSQKVSKAYGELPIRDTDFKDFI